MISTGWEKLPACLTTILSLLWDSWRSNFYIETERHTVSFQISAIENQFLSRVGHGQSLAGRPDAAGGGVGRPVGGTLSSGLKKYPNAPGQWLRTLPCVGCRLSDGMLNGCPDSLEVIKDPMALIVRVGVLTLVSWLNSQSGSQTITVT